MNVTSEKAQDVRNFHERSEWVVVMHSIPTNDSQFPTQNCVRVIDVEVQLFKIGKNRFWIKKMASN